MSNKLFSIIILFFLISVTTNAQVEQAFPNLTFDRPIELQHAGDNTNRLFVAEQDGIIWVFERDYGVTTKKVFLDIQDHVNNVGNEMGLLGLAFDPEYASNGNFYVYYSTSRFGGHKSQVSQFTVSATNPDSANKSSEQFVIDIIQPAGNHNGGKIAFGPDNHLYIALGDGGGGGDPDSNGQDRTTLLGSILRITPDLVDKGHPYTIPADNPFVGNTQGYRSEIFAYGLRNPWRFSFDDETGRLWAGDVGQGAWEEVDLIESGKNYGWNTMEGNHCYNTSNCDTSGLTLPVVEYPHNFSTGGYSITGGYVYRADASSDLYGKYIYADYVTGIIWALEYIDENNSSTSIIYDTNLSIASFGTDQFKNIYMCAFDGKIYQLEPPVVPVELVSFGATVNGSSVNLKWKTATEINNMGFEIQKSKTTDDDVSQSVSEDWQVIGFVDGNGSTSESKEYFFSDNLAESKAYYRLKQMDYDGSFEYSNTIEVNKGSINIDGYSLKQNYPNPFNPSTKIEYSIPAASKVELKIYDVLGNELITLVNENKPAGNYLVEFNASNYNHIFSSGVYLYTIKAGSFTETRKLVLLK